METDLIQKIDRIHPYPAKFTVDLAIKYIEKYTKPHEIVYDPFVGSGTTLLASRYLDRNSYGTDVNHIAILISKFKTRKFTSVNIKNLKQYADELKDNFVKKVNDVVLTDYPSINHWFCGDSIKVLSYIKNSFDLLTDENEKIFAQTVFSSIINIVSNQESDTRYAAVVKPRLNCDYVFNAFLKKFESSLDIIEGLIDILNNNSENIPLLLDSNDCDKAIPCDIDLILTSPPYPNTYDYYLYHKHRMNWLGFDVNYSMDKEIGSRREYSSLKHPKEKFDDDIYRILSHCNNLLKKDGHVVLIMGDGRIQGQDYDAKNNMINICSELGWQLVDYNYSLLDQTSRSFQKSYRTKGKKEHNLVFKKV